MNDKVGNGLADNAIDLNSFVPVYGYHNLIPFWMYQDLVETCQGNYINDPNAACEALLEQAGNSISDLDPYGTMITTRITSYRYLRTSVSRIWSLL